MHGLTHAMFADDTTLMARSREDLVSMIIDVREALAPHGLNLNLDKCCIQTNTACQDTCIDIEGASVPIVQPSVGFKILGTILTADGKTSAEVRSRINAGWAKFHKLWPLLGKRGGMMKERLRLFDMCVGQTVLWCCESWNLTQKEKQKLRSVQHDMLRRIAGPKRSAEESWLEWIKRSTRRARTVAKSAGVRFWVEEHLRKKWSWAVHVARMSEERLARRATTWRDSAWWAVESVMPYSERCRRPGRTRWFRWEDDLRRYMAKRCGGIPWQEFAQNRSTWTTHIMTFVRSS